MGYQGGLRGRTQPPKNDAMSTTGPKLNSKRLLHHALCAAAKLEHQFMCQYLYATFSLKKHADETCQPHELEAVRRWASVLYMIARQEMEHLSIVNSLLTATGGMPCYTHLNFPSTMARRELPRAPEAAPSLKRIMTDAKVAEVPREAVHKAREGVSRLPFSGRGERELGEWEQGAKLGEQEPAEGEPCPMPFVLEPFSLNAVRRFACMEAPDVDHVQEPELSRVKAWCFRDKDRQCKCVQAFSVPTPSRPGSPFQAEKVEIGTIEELYEEVRKGLEYLVERLGEGEVFNGRVSGQSEIPSEYMITLFPIRDLESALCGIELITVQGEGIQASPGYESHFMRFVKMAEEYEELEGRATAQGRRFEPARPLPSNPKPEDFEVGSVARKAVELFQEGYVLLLYMLTGYYQDYRPSKWSQYPYLAQALQQTAFAPMMTMLVRSLAEVIVELPVGKGKAGPTFHLTPEARELLERPEDSCYQELMFYVEKLRRLCEGIGGLEQSLGSDQSLSSLRPKVTFMGETMKRVVLNLEEITEQGTFPQFDFKTA